MRSMRRVVLTACLAGIVLALPQAEPGTERATAARVARSKPTICSCTERGRTPPAGTA
ncbi:MAG: hypothetical protein QOE72_4179 [Chloroflexota bacterium]|jgi:hypothetical protein|nr:hypothetical protein [Chloroflexota bacterium]